MTRAPSGRTPHSDACDDLDALLDGLGIVLAGEGDPLPVDRAMLERWSRHGGRALLYLTETAPASDGSQEPQARAEAPASPPNGPSGLLHSTPEPAPKCKGEAR